MEKLLPPLASENFAVQERTKFSERVMALGDHARDIRDGVQSKLNLFRQLTKPDGNRIGVLEGNQDCNRRCSYCDVPNQYDVQTESTLQESFRAIDLLKRQKYPLLSYLGGEPFAPFNTKEGITFTKHTLEIVRYAGEQGMIVNVTTNGDYIPKNPEVIRELKDAGLDSLTLSLHYTAWS